MAENKKYPLSYEEYEDKIVELFLEEYSDEQLEEMTKRIDDLLGEENNFIQQLYGYDCFTYDSPHIYGDTCKKAFEDDFLKQTPVAQLRMLIG